MKTIRAYLLFTFVVGLLAHTASAFTSTWNAASGNWSEPLNWSPMGDPNGTNFDVIFNNGGSLTLDSARTIGSYSQTLGTFTITNAQSLILNSAGALDGGGVMILGNINSAIYNLSPNVVLTNSAGTIRGNGQIGYNGLSVLNQANGIIQADVPGELLYLNGSGTFTNNGLMRAQGGGTLILDGSSGANFVNNATIRSEDGSNVNILFSRVVGGMLDNTGSTGTITLNDAVIRDVTIPAGSTVTTGANRTGILENLLVNHGTLAAATGEVLYIATDTTLSGGGTIALQHLSNILNLGSNRTLTNNDNVLRCDGQICQIGYDSLSVVNGADGSIQTDISGQTLHLNGSGNFVNNGLMRASNGATLYFSGTGTITNSGGTLHVLPTSIIKGDGGIIQTAGTINLDGGNMNFPLGIDLNGGLLVGTGTFTGPIRNNGGIVGPGHSPGRITVAGDYTQAANGSLTMEIGGNAAGTEYDQLVVNGTATLGGTLNVSLINGFQPQVGDVFQLILSGSFTGTFSTIHTTGFTGQVNYSASGITFTVTGAAGTLLNISTRLRVQTGDNVLIGGFILSGTDPKRVIVRAIGPSLAGVPEALADTTLELRNGSGQLLAENDNWKDTQQAEIEATTIPPANDLESAIVTTLPANNAGYTAIVRGKNNTTGIGLVEVYDLDQAALSRLANISTRGFVETNDNVLIGGFILGGSSGASSRVVVRALGPSLGAVGVADALSDPTLDLKDANGSTLISNDDWQQTQAAEITATGLAPTDVHESAVLIALPNGTYTAIVRGTGNTTGVGLVEVYNLQ